MIEWTYAIGAFIGGLVCYFIGYRAGRKDARKGQNR